MSTRPNAFPAENEGRWAATARARLIAENGDYAGNVDISVIEGPDGRLYMCAAEIVAALGVMYESESTDKHSLFQGLVGMYTSMLEAALNDAEAAGAVIETNGFEDRPDWLPRHFASAKFMMHMP